MNNVIKRVWNQNKMVQIEDLQGMTFQAETAGHTFEITGIDDAGEALTLTGTPAGVFLRPDNTDVALTCSVTGGKVYATLPGNCYDVPGRFAITIFLTSDSQKTALYAGIGTVSRTSSGTAAPGTTQSVVDLINAINAAVNSIPADYSSLLADIAPTYSNSALYSVGQYAWYDGDLKRCIVPITTAESYTAAHWTSAVLGNDVSDLKSALNTAEERMLIIQSNGKYEISPTLEQGRYNSGATTKNHNNTKYVLGDFIIIDPQKVFKLTVPTGFKCWYTGARKDGSWYFQSDWYTAGTHNIDLHSSKPYTRYIGLNIQNTSESDIGPSDVPENGFVVSQQDYATEKTDYLAYKEKLTKEHFYTIDGSNEIGYTFPKVEQGRYASLSVNKQDSNIFVRSEFVPINPQLPFTTYIFSSSYTYWLTVADENMNYVIETGSKSSGAVYDFSESYPNARYVAYNIKKNDNSNISPSDIPENYPRIYQENINEVIKTNQTLNRGNAQSTVAMLSNEGGQIKVEFEQGRFYSGSGKPSPSIESQPNWVRSKEPILVNSSLPYIITRTHSLNMTVYQYDKDFNWVREDSINSSSIDRDRTFDSKTCYINIAVYNSNGVTPETIGGDTFFIQVPTQGGGDTIPDYFKTQIDDKLPTIIGNMNAAGDNGETFIFITDPHWETNYKMSPKLMKYILNRTNITNILCGGDMINEGDKPTMYKTLIACVKAFQFPLCNMFLPISRGNHDDNSNWSSAADVASHEFDYATVYNLVMNQVANKVKRLTSTEFSFYFDHEDTKTRFIFLDTQRGGGSVPYFAVRSLLQATGSGWHVVFCSHMLYATEYSAFYFAMGIIANMAKAYNERTSGSSSGIEYDFTNGDYGEVVLFIGGHLHSDVDFDSDDSTLNIGIPIICTDTDSYRNHSGTGGTVNSQCFDVVTVDYNNRTIKCVRIGRGLDRSFTLRALN